jgi:hypothetical protein
MKNDKAKEFIRKNFIVERFKNNGIWQNTAKLLTEYEQYLSSHPLPTDEKIEEEATEYSELHTVCRDNEMAFADGAKWLRDTHSPSVDLEEMRKEFFDWMYKGNKLKITSDEIVDFFINYLTLK